MPAKELRVAENDRKPSEFTQDADLRQSAAYIAIASAAARRSPGGGHQVSAGRRDSTARSMAGQLFSTELLVSATGSLRRKGGALDLRARTRLSLNAGHADTQIYTRRC